MAVDIRGITCSFGKRRAIDDLSLRIPAGTVLGIAGPNGAGKTTLIDTMCGLIRPSQGTVFLLGEDVANAGPSLRARIGVLPQTTALYEEVSARRNLRFAAALYGVRSAEARIAEVLELVGLTSRANDAVGGFSGGMQRRLAIARTLLHDPALLILDEPTVGVDVEARHQIWSHVRSLKAAGRTVVLTTNYLDEAEALCDRIAILRDGKLVVEDTPAALMARTGRCLELECHDNAVPQLLLALRNHPAVMRAESTGPGVRVYVASEARPEEIVQAMRGSCTIDGFRTRAPDLAEVFVSLTGPKR